MKYLIIDDNGKFAKQLFKQLTGNESNSEKDIKKPSNENLNDFSETIKSVINGSKDIVLCINVNLEVGKDSRQLQKGIELLIWLRIKGVINHCVLYSFENLHTLLRREPKHLIASSQGTTFVQLPNNFSKINLRESNNEKADTKSAKTALKATFDIIQFRHSYANIWGLERLVDAHKLVEPNTQLSLSNQYLNNLNYQVAKYIYTSECKFTQISKDDIEIIRRILVKARPKGNKIHKILYIDDQAKSGWLNLLQTILGSQVEVHTIPVVDDLNRMFHTAKVKIEQEKIALVISDLRLFEREEGYINYEDFLSVQLMKQLRDAKVGGKLLFKDFGYMLFTASNRLHYYKTMIKGKKYAPQGLFIKEGFDMLLNEQRSFENYCQLVKTLGSFFTVYRRKAGEDVELFNEDECKACIRMDNKIKNGVIDEVATNIKNKLSRYTHVVLDSNVFIGFEDIPLATPKNLLTPYPVYKELERNVSDDWNSLKGFLADYFVNKAQINPSKLGLTEDDIKTIDEKFKSGKNLEDVADEYFVKVLDAIRQEPNSNVLFLTNDYTDKGGKLSPTSAVKEWVKEKKIKNVFVKSPKGIVSLDINEINVNTKSVFKGKHSKQNRNPLINPSPTSTPLIIKEVVKEIDTNLIVTVKNETGEFCIFLTPNDRDRLRSLTDNSVHNIVGTPVQQSKTTKTKEIDGMRYRNLNVNLFFTHLIAKSNTVKNSQP